MSVNGNLPALLERYGAPPDAVLLLDVEPTPDHLRYIDLVKAAGAGDVRPDAVVELQGSPFLYVAQSNQATFAPLRRLLAVRGDGSFLGLFEPGRLTIYSLGVSGSQALYSVPENDPTAASLIPRLALRPPETQPDAVHNLLFRLLDGVTNQLAAVGVGPEDSLSLAGRALFLRFLVDRRVVQGHELHTVCATASKFEECFATAENIERSSNWLDTTFNGDLLHLSPAVRNNGKLWFNKFSKVRQQTIYDALSAIMYRTEPTGQGILSWEDIDFAHVPVGLLSQVYERYCRVHEKDAKATSIHYTPRAIAEYMVEEAFGAMPNAHEARVLDPAAGAGVFLVSAFRKLIEARWGHDGKRPTKRVIREILYRQLAGFEINESALRLAALSLYLTAIELDPNPRPAKDLRFEKLRDRVLFQVKEAAAVNQTTGSLGPAAGLDHNGRYDLVVGNPPWTAIKRDTKYRQTVWKGLEQIVKSRLDAARSEAFQIPDDVPDLAFLWRSMGWAKPGGQIALAMHGRFLFKRSSGGLRSRADVFRALRVTGILNGAALQETNVWRISAPFCLIFAKNELPTESSDGFYFASPEHEDALNKRGRLRIDAKSAHVVRAPDVEESPSLLKTLYRGTVLDDEVLRKISTSTRLALRDYWHAHALSWGSGFVKGGKNVRNADAALLRSLPTLTSDRLNAFKIDTAALPKFEGTKVHRSRDSTIYQPPLVVVRKAPGEDREMHRAALALEPMAYHETFYGFSCAGHPNAEELARYLLVFFNSMIPVYVALLTATQYGVDRRVYHKEDLELQPFHPLEELNGSLRAEMGRLSDLLLRGEPDFEATDAWASKVYGLNRWDQEVIADTLAINSPYVSCDSHAQMPPSPRVIRTFLSRLTEQMRPFLRSNGHSVTAAVTSQAEPWIWFDLVADGTAPINSVDHRHTATVADHLGATQIISCSPGRVSIGLLQQTRYWTVSRARLLALELLQNSDVIRMLTSGNVA